MKISSPSMGTDSIEMDVGHPDPPAPSKIIHESNQAGMETMSSW